MSNGDKTKIFVGTTLDSQAFLIKGHYLKIAEGGPLRSTPDAGALYAIKHCVSGSIEGYLPVK